MKQLEELKMIAALKADQTGNHLISQMLLYCPVLFANTEEIAYTDGITIFVGKRLFDFPFAEQIGILIHEVCHILLCHCERLLQIPNSKVEIYQIAADLVVNQMVLLLNQKEKWCELPKEGCFFKDRKLIDPEALEDKPAFQWTTEETYYYLLKNFNCPPKKAPQDLQPNTGEIPPEVPRWAQESYLKSPSQREAERHEWISEILQGAQSLEIYATLANEFPPPSIPWQKEFRPFMVQPLLIQKEADWSRPNRRMASTGSRIFQPSRKKQRGVPLAGIIWDTSGSIYANPNLLNQTVSEIQAVQSLTGCNIVLILIDTRIQAEYLIPNDGKSFKQKVLSQEIKVKGGGGSDMGPAVQRLEEYKVNVGAAFTDMEVNFGVEPNYPILWVAYESDRKAPFGKTIKAQLHSR